MKKILLFIFACVGVITFAVAQNLQILYQNNVQSNGAVINVQGDATHTLKAKLFVKNLSSETTLQVKAKKNPVNVVSSSMNTFCFAGYCYSPATIVSTSSATIAPSEKDTTFEADYEAYGSSGVSSIQYVFFNVNNPSDSTWVTVAFEGVVGIQESDLNSFIKVDAYPNPASNSVNFSYTVPSQVGSQKIIIRNMLGATVKTIDLEDRTSGKKQINIEDLKDGIYFYSVLADNKIYQTKKLIIKR